MQRASRLQYQIETSRTGTFFGHPIGGGPSCCYTDSAIEDLREPHKTTPGNRTLKASLAFEQDTSGDVLIVRKYKN